MGQIKQNVFEGGAHTRFSNPSVQGFINNNDTGLSFSNLFYISIYPPNVYFEETENNGNPWPKSTDHGLPYKMFNLYAQAINMPSKQLMTGQVVDIGTVTKFATGVGYGSCNMTFNVPRDHWIRSFYEQWMNMIIADSNNYVEDYESYVARRIRIYKLERGDGDRANESRDFDNGRLRLNYPRKEVRDQVKVNKVVACLELRNVFPQNIGTTQLSQRDSRLTTMTVGFNYERYRLFTANKQVGTFLDNRLEKFGRRNSSGFNNVYW